MAKGMPDALQLRESKYGIKSQPSNQSALAARMVSEGRIAEGLDLYLLAHDENGIASIRARAIKEGRPVWLMMIERAGATIPAAEWKQCGEAAEKAGRFREAYRAFTFAADEAALERIHESLPGYEIYVPQGK